MRPDDNKLWRSKLYDIIVEADTPNGKLFDVVLLIAIAASTITVLLESVISIRESISGMLSVLEWVFTGLFTAEYILRIIAVKRAKSYIFSFYGGVDFVAVIPTYIGLLFPGAQYLLILRSLRLLRIFRVFNMGRYISEARTLALALQVSFRKILVFLLFILILVLILGSLIYLIEGEENGYTNIPVSIYWAIVTITTAGYGDIVPLTVLGKFLANIIMILGYAIIAVQTGIVTVEMARTRSFKASRKVCSECTVTGHDVNANYRKFCGTNL